MTSTPPPLHASPPPTRAASRRRWLRVGKFLAYPFFYVFCLAFFGYLSFPWDQLKDRVIAEFNKAQAKEVRRPGERPMRLEIDELDSYWFTGVEITGARLIIPPKPKRKSARNSLGGFGAAADKEEPAPAESVVRVNKLTARARLLPLLTGKVVVDFDAEAFGGEIEGTIPVGTAGDDVEVSFAGLQLLDVQPLQAMLEGVPLSGTADGSLKLTPKEGKLSKADGGFNVTISAVKLGKPRKGEDGAMEDVVEIQGIAIPSVVLGTLSLQATAKDGALTLAELSAKSADFELLGEGNIKLNEAWDKSRAEMFIKFKFTDEYRTKSPAATSLLGKPGDKSPLIELGSPDIKRAKTEDDFYRFRIHGALGNLDFDPAGSAAGLRAPRTTRRDAATSRRTPTRRGAAGDDDDDDDPVSPRPAPTPRPVRTPVRRPTPAPDPGPMVEPVPDDPPDDPQPGPEEAPDDATPDEGSDDEATAPDDGGEGG